MDWKSTLLLPDADFTIAMKADLATREPMIQARWDEIGIYHLLQKTRKDAPAFVLHDGPPYTNNPVHLGTAVNKILKDFVLKSKSMAGFRCPYVPGYDNHGLPIEQHVLAEWAAELRKTPGGLEAVGAGEKCTDNELTNRLKERVKEFRDRCRAHATKYIDVQTSQFKRLGVFGLWEKPYRTMDFRYEGEMIRIFRRLVENDQVYRGLRPVMWSPTSRTALADTEIIYNDKTSQAIYVRFPLVNDGGHGYSKYPNLYTIIWTTTPWTIPANLACAFHPEFDYAIVRAGDCHYLVLNQLVEKTMGACGITDYEVLAYQVGSELENVVFQHPIHDRTSRAVLADYVTTEDGTGVVHTAPGHGREDFLTGMKYGLPILCPVDSSGVMTAEAGEFEGLYYEKCTFAVVERLKELGHLLGHTEITHSYPHAERDGKPVIFRTTDQWFVSIDDNDLRKRMLDQIEKTRWYPPSAQRRIESMVAGRPDWCISRQRPWGVGIPVFYGAKSGTAVLDPVAINAVADLVEREGSDAWFLKSAAEILPAGYKLAATGETEFIKETDVFDVWFDSGCTNLCVLEGNVEPEWKEHWPADLYLEGSDQHRGWFNTSLVIGCATRDQAPYKAVMTHGFVLDEQREKMSKRKGNVIDPEAAANSFGADVLRYWAATVDYSEDVPCGENILKQIGDQYRTIRNSMRFLLANLNGFDGNEPTELLELDQWAIEQCKLLVADCVDAYEAYEFGRVMSNVHNFCSKDISAFYLDAIKDRMYCDGEQWASRKSGQWASNYLINQLVKLIAPILPHTAEEVYEKLPRGSKLDSIHLETFDRPSANELRAIAESQLETRFAKMLEIRAEVFAQFESVKGTDGLKNSQDAACTLGTTQENADLLASFGDDLPNLFKMSSVKVEVGEPKVCFEPSAFELCDRSRLRRADVTTVALKSGEEVKLTARDQKVMQELGLL
jgi:isoleucyl-tRNA synthetase